MKKFREYLEMASSSDNYTTALISLLRRTIGGPPVASDEDRFAAWKSDIKAIEGFKNDKDYVKQFNNLSLIKQLKLNDKTKETIANKINLIVNG